MHSILLKPQKRVPLSTVDTAKILQMISIPDLNPNHERIQILRSLPKSDPEYSIIKKDLQCFTPNASFSGYVSGKNVSSSSGYVYIDFDSKEGFDITKEYNILKQNPNVYAAWTSASGTGIGCLLKATWTDTSGYTFKQAFNCALESLERFGSGMQYVDTGCNDITRVNFISSSDVYINERAVTVEKKEYKIFKNVKGDTAPSFIPPSIKELTSPFSSDNCDDTVYYQSRITDWVPGESYRYIPEGKPFVHIYVGQDKISVGRRTKSLFLIGCKLAVINPGVSEKTLFKHILSINTYYCVKPKSKEEVLKITKSVIKSQSEGALYAPGRLKYVWFNPAARISPKEKQSISSKIIGQHRKNITFDLLEQHITELRRDKIKITQNVLAEKSGLSVRTVRRYWQRLKELIF